ncbi:hypothetical protein C1850_11470, partial [Adlercreutzia equolifaciens subsp. celatus]
RDAELAAGRPAGLRMRDRRERTLATEVGDVSFSRCRYAGEEGAVGLHEERLPRPLGGGDDAVGVERIGGGLVLLGAQRPGR